MIKSGHLSERSRADSQVLQRNASSPSHVSHGEYCFQQLEKMVTVITAASDQNH